MDVLVQKETISEEPGVSLATVNNWIKTHVIHVQKYYSRRTFNHIIKNDQTRLSSGANRTLQAKKNLCCPGITNKDRKKTLSILVNDFENSNLSINEKQFNYIK